jgi:predicted anti-sigma-YlaC factor YlaD
MKCSEVRKLVPLCAGGDLEPDEAKLVQEHVASCENCRALLDACSADRKLVASLRGRGPQPPGFANFWARLREKLAPEIHRRRVRLVAHSVLRVVTTAAVLMIAVTFLWHLRPEAPVARPEPVMVEPVGTLHEEVKLETKQQGLELEECELCVDTSRKFDF